MFMWLYIIYHNLYINNIQTLYVLYDENNNKYSMIDFYNMKDHNLPKVLSKELNKINYFENNKYIGSNFLNNKDGLVVVPYDSIKYITHKLISKSKFKIDPFKKMNKLNNLDNLYLENIYNYKIDNIDIPFHLISNTNGIKVSLKSL